MASYSVRLPATGDFRWSESDAQRMIGIELSGSTPAWPLPVCTSAVVEDEGRFLRLTFEA
ncbi:MAG TPA: hypothetical protein VKD47_01290 [Miltoncostaeaceae bacterium]|nr:hypothetical protein [Miltoncostaeaceae bacterium]